MESRILESALRALREYPLCDRCLGRLYARLGKGWDNKSRGDAVKRALLMELHWKSREDDTGSRAILSEIAGNIGDQASWISGVGEPKPCYVCGGRIEDVIGSASRNGSSLLKAFDAASFVVGVKLDPEVHRREEEVKSAARTPYGESIKAEIRREVGKRIASTGVARVDFDEPEAMLIVSFPSGSIEIQVNSLLLRTRYWKLARNISQSYWPSPEGPRYFSVEQALWNILKPTGGERLVLHAAGREDVDARMLGSGRPAILEIKTPRRRRLDLKYLESVANEGGLGLVKIVIEGYARRPEIELYKENVASVRKTYRALIAVEGGIEPGEIEKIEKNISGSMIVQRTPWRVAHRRADIVRRKRVHSVKCHVVDSAVGVVECLIEAEGGLYVKELVSGDEGRTSPSFAEVLGRQAICVELDVVWVKHEHLEKLQIK